MAQNELNVNHLSVGGNLILKGIAVVTPKSGNKVKIGTVAPGVILAPKQALDEVTFLFPQKVQDGQVMYLSFLQDVASVIFSGANFASASTIGPKVKAGDNITLMYNEKLDKWLKIAGNTNVATVVPKK